MPTEVLWRLFLHMTMNVLHARLAVRFVSRGPVFLAHPTSLKDQQYERNDKTMYLDQKIPKLLATFLPQVLVAWAILCRAIVDYFSNVVALMKNEIDTDNVSE